MSGSASGRAVVLLSGVTVLATRPDGLRWNLGTLAWQASGRPRQPPRRPHRRAQDQLGAAPPGGSAGGADGNTRMEKVGAAFSVTLGTAAGDDESRSRACAQTASRAFLTQTRGSHLGRVARPWLPAVRAHALESCRKDMPGGTPTPAQQAQDVAQALALSSCMRRNGVPRLPRSTKPDQRRHGHPRSDRSRASTRSRLTLSEHSRSGNGSSPAARRRTRHPAPKAR